MENSHYYKEFSTTPKGTVRYWKMKASKSVNSSPTPVDTDDPEFIPPRIDNDTKDLAHIIASIENPVAFASAHIFKKMLETGDVRWAQLYVSVLDKTNKLDYETTREQEWLKQAKDMSMEEIVSRVAVKGSILKNISRQLERAEDTSPYDNF